MSDDGLLWITAVGAAATAVATFLLVLVAAKTLGGARNQLTLLREQFASEARPYVVANVVPGLQGPGFWDLTLDNLGRTMASDLTVSVVPILLSVDPQDHISESLGKYLAVSRVLAPGARHRLMWRMDPGALPSGRTAGASAESIITVRYVGTDGVRYEEQYPFALDTLGEATPIPTDGPRATGDDAELTNIVNALRTLAIHLGELRR